MSELLSEAEHRVVSTLVDAVNIFTQEVVGAGLVRDGDVNEFCHHVLVLQRMVLSQGQDDEISLDELHLMVGRLTKMQWYLEHRGYTSDAQILAEVLHGLGEYIARQLDRLPPAEVKED